jgi:predicted metal-dependent phosphoesterase TrpH
MLLADLHVHSRFSDGQMTVPELVDFYGSRGFGCIAITDHICEPGGLMGWAASAMKYTLTREHFPLYLRLIESEAARAWRQYRMIVLPGYELSKNSLFNHRSAHLLGLGVKEWLPAHLDVAEMCLGLRSQSAAVVAAHPVFTGRYEKQTYHIWNRREELRHLIDAWEVASGTTIFQEVATSGLPMLATSDLHTPRQINAWKTILDCDPDQEACLQAIREQKLRFFFYRERADVQAKGSEWVRQWLWQGPAPRLSHELDLEPNQTWAPSACP